MISKIRSLGGDDVDALKRGDRRAATLRGRPPDRPFPAMHH